MESPISNPVFVDGSIVDLRLRHESCCVNLIDRKLETMKTRSKPQVHRIESNQIELDELLISMLTETKRTPTVNIDSVTLTSNSSSVVYFQPS